MGMAHLRDGEGLCCSVPTGRVARFTAVMLFRFLRRLVTADIMALFLVLIALQAVTYGISSSLQNTNTTYFFWICVVAVLLALGFHRLRLSGVQASLIMFIVGVLGIWLI